MNQSEMLSDSDSIFAQLGKSEPALLALWEHDHFRQTAQEISASCRF